MKIKKSRLLEIIKEEIENLDEMMPLASFVPNTRKVPTDPEKAYGWDSPEVRDEIKGKFDKLAPEEQESLLRDLIMMKAGKVEEGLLDRLLKGREERKKRKEGKKAAEELLGTYEDPEYQKEKALAALKQKATEEDEALAALKAKMRERGELNENKQFSLIVDLIREELKNKKTPLEES